MPITRSAKKALRASDKKRIFNLRQKDTILRSVKGLKRAVTAKSKDEAGKALSLAYKALDKAAKKGLIKKNAASRKKSRLVKLAKKIAA